MYYILVGGFKHVLFSIIYGITLPIDFHIYQRGRAQPPTSYVSCESCVKKLYHEIPRIFLALKSYIYIYTYVGS